MCGNRSKNKWTNIAFVLKLCYFCNQLQHLEMLHVVKNDLKRLTTKRMTPLEKA